MPCLIDETIGLAALTMCIMRMLYRLRVKNQRWRIYNPMLLNENRWRAMRYGTDERLLDLARGKLVPFATLLSELIDVVATERGIAINPRRRDLLEAVRDSDLPIRPIEELKDEVEKLCGGQPAPPRITERPVAVIKWVDGTVLDTVYQVL